MAKKHLIIVESPAKARTIQKFVDTKYVVKASMGHIKDLPRSTLGVDTEKDFNPKYVTIRGKEPVIRELKEAAKDSGSIFLAPDPDREGEAIAWHLSKILDSDKVYRINLHEITKPAVNEALAHPQNIDMEKVFAQQARRILDRLVGYLISPLLWRKVTRGLSAGRVQSVAVRLICEREREIQAFVAEEYWTITSVLSKRHDDAVFNAVLSHIDGEKAKISDGDMAGAIVDELRDLPHAVKDIVRKEQRRNPAPPFITSSLQQEASRRLGFRVGKTMQVAQQLYEGCDIGPEGRVGLISYMRTDSTRISDAARNEAVDYIRTKFGEHYIGGPRKYKTSPGAQEAHEAIRPTSVLRTPAALKQWLTPDQFRLYNLIWERFLASQMASQVLDVENVDIAAGKYLLKAQGITVKFAGYTVMYEESRDEENGEDKADGLPPLVAGDSLVLRDLLPKQHFTQPPPRYTEATLVKTLEEKGIGRPSTYAPIVDTIIKREYVELKEKKFHPTKLGFVVTDILTSHFPSVVNIDFTADMEQKLDKIEDGQEDWIKILKDFYGPFSDTLSKADSAIEKVTLEPEMTNEVCDLCGKPMVVKKSRFGKFLACSGYPECKGTKSFTKEIGLKCPREGCPGQVVERRSKKGRFYGCNQYPKCDFVSWGKPTDKKCQRCGNVMVLSPTRAGKVYLKCIDPKCVAEKKGKAKAAAKQEE